MWRCLSFYVDERMRSQLQTTGTRFIRAALMTLFVFQCWQRMCSQATDTHITRAAYLTRCFAEPVGIASVQCKSSLRTIGRPAQQCKQDHLRYRFANSGTKL